MDQFPEITVMSCEEITPHLNKISTLYLKDNKRKVGWIFLDKPLAQMESPELVYFISVQKGRRLMEALETGNTKILEENGEIIPVNLIERIRSSR